jgi:FAD:protein FMN transferase
MRDTRIVMGMPITVEIADASSQQNVIDKIFSYFTHVDEKFSTYKDASEIMKINRGEIGESEYSEDMKTVFALCQATKKQTLGFFDIRTPHGAYDPSGLVKGWAIKNAAEMLLGMGCENFYVDAGGDIQAHGKNTKGGEWTVGIRNPFNRKEIVKVIYPRGAGVATSGTYIRGQHIYNPHNPGEPIAGIMSVTVIGPDIYEADRFATAAFAMEHDGAAFIESLAGFEAYCIDARGVATMTSGFEQYATP